MTTPKPTAAELAILRVLWRRRRATVRDVHQQVHEGSTIGYTTTLKIMQNMLGKGLVTRSDDGRQHVYEPAVAEAVTLNGLVGGWVDTVFAGSSLALAMRALEARPVDADELQQLKDLVARIEAQEG